MRVHIDWGGWHLDVGSSYPRAGEGSKGSAVRRVKGYVSWVKYDASQYGFYLLGGEGSIEEAGSGTQGFC